MQKDASTLPVFSIIMASRLAPYQGAASNRERKIIRAINSALNQSFSNLELIVVADGCKKTLELIEDYYFLDQEPRLKVFSVEHVGLWSGHVRNTGIEKAKGQWIVYLDIDDMLGRNHLQIIKAGINSKPAETKWFYFNDYLANPKIKSDEGIVFQERYCDIDKIGKNGTSNICHLRKLETRWEHYGNYKHDWNFIRALYYQQPREFIPTPEYCVCHYPNTVDV